MLAADGLALMLSFSSVSSCVRVEHKFGGFAAGDVGVYPPSFFMFFKLYPALFIS
jgi:hypothetical protein